MNRAELESLDRDALILRAESAGVTRARVLTRPELVDELLMRSAMDRGSRQRARGLFGRARDLLARVVEQGLHLPDAADRIRSAGTLLVRGATPDALPTVTLAEIYVAQGHRDRAIDTLENVLRHEPDHAAAHSLFTQLRDGEVSVPSPRMPPEGDDEPAGRAELEPHPGDDEAAPAAFAIDAPAYDAPAYDAPAYDAPAYDAPGNDAPGNDAPGNAAPGNAAPGNAASPPHAAVVDPDDADECVAVPVDANTAYVCWGIRRSTLETLRGACPSGRVALRAVVILPTWEGPQSSVRDHEVHGLAGEFFVRDLPTGAVVRVAVGYCDEARFSSIAHSPALHVAPGAAPSLGIHHLVRWTPTGSRPVHATDRDAASIQRAVARAVVSRVGP